MGARGIPEIDYSVADHWAVGLVVNEGVKMNLNETEMVLAAGRMRDKGLTDEEIRTRLRVSLRKSDQLLQRWRRSKKPVG